MISLEPMKTLRRIIDFYVDGFRNMTVGKTLWAIIIVKLVVIFLILKVFFFPNYIKENAKEGQEAEFVSEQMIGTAP